VEGRGEITLIEIVRRDRSLVIIQSGLRIRLSGGNPKTIGSQFRDRHGITRHLQIRDDVLRTFIYDESDDDVAAVARVEFRYDLHLIKAVRFIESRQLADAFFVVSASGQEVRSCRGDVRQQFFSVEVLVALERNLRDSFPLALVDSIDDGLLSVVALSLHIDLRVEIALV